jgi:hypothetical protein
MAMARLTKKASAQLTAYLGELPTERLVVLVMNQAEQDVALRTQLLLEAASVGGPLDVSSYRRSFSDVLRSGSANRRDCARTSGPWARAGMGVVRQIGDLLPHHAAAVIDITEYALGRVDVTMSRVDDSSGWFSQITSELAWDGRLDEAWAVADEHGASLSIWKELAKASETDRPINAARAYGRDVEAQIDRKKTWTYESAVEQVAYIRTLYERGSDPSGFETYLADLRHRHRQKTKFIRLLDEADLR